MVRWLSSLQKNARGGVLTVTALTLPVVVVISALSVDLGRLYMAREAAVGAVRYAAEAGAGRLPDEDSATLTARRVAAAHVQLGGSQDSQNIDVTINGSRIVVQMDVSIVGTFSRFVGRPVLETSVSAGAGI